MQKSSTAGVRNPLLLCVLILGLMAAFFVLPYQFRSEANSQKKKGLFQRTESHEEGLENYDIREQKSDEVADALLRFRQESGKDSAMVADLREGFVRGEEALKSRVPTLKVEYNQDIRTPELIAPDVKQGRNFLTSAASGQNRVEILRNFVKENNDLIGVTDEQANNLKVLADYTNPDGNLSYVHLEQRIDGIPIFRSEVKAGFTKQNEMIRVINNLAPGLEYESLSTDFRDPVDAVKAASRHINRDPGTLDLKRNESISTDLKAVFGQGDWATTAEKIYFPTEPGIAVPAWRVIIIQPVNGYMIIVDAKTGTLLWRKNATEDQTQSGTYNVYTNSNAMINIADSPAPLTPGPTNPADATQGTLIASRTNVTRIGNEAPYTFNNLGWINDGANITDGNAVEAGVDRVAPDGVDAPISGDSACPGAGCRTFTSTWNPPPATPADEPLTAQAQRGAVTMMFYAMNLYHDEMYRLGFTEQAFNFQNDNFGRGGAGNDRVSAEGQDSSGTNNANFLTLPDGTRGRMQMFLWSGPTPDKDGTTDIDVVIHEVTHGTSNRLHGNASGLSNNMSRAMGEGWSDFYGHVMLSEPTDPVNGIYTTGGYATHLLSATYTSNYYYGIRRWPKAVMAFTGGPNNRPHNPFTFKHLNAGCDSTLGTTTNAISSAFPRSPVIATAGSCDQVHNGGEIWSSTLWEVRAKFVQRLGWAVGNRKTLQLVTDGMKLAPIGPTFLQERDAILAAALASSAAPEAAADVADVWEGFRIRGMGFGASVQTISPASVTENFDPPNASMTNPFSVSDSTGDNDGFPEPGEPVLLSIAVTNTTGSTVNSVQVSVAGGGTVSYGNVASGATVTNTVPYTVPADAECGSMHTVSITVSSAVGTNQPQTRSFRLGAPVGGAPATFTSSTAITIGPDAGASVPYGTTINVTGLTGNKVIKLELTGVTHTFPGDLDYLLVGPGGQKYIALSDSGSTGDVSNLTMTLTDGAAAQPSTTQWVPGEFRPFNTGTNDPFAAPAPTGPYTNAPPAGTDTLTSVFGSNGANLNGTWALFVVDDANIDGGTMAGWKLTFEANDYLCNFAGTVRSRADFDGDGRSDLSVFRPSEGNWYLNQSNAGFGVINWGLGTDTLTPADFDGDNRTDTAIFRPDANSSNPDFYVLNSNGFTVSGYSWGIAGDIPVVRDYDADNKADIAVFRPSDNTWYILKSTGGNDIVTFGQAGDVPVAGDFNGDGRGDYTVYRSGTWWTQLAGGGTTSVPLGTAGDILVPADYDGDNKDDIAVFRPSSGSWIVINSNGGSTTTTQWGAAGDVPVPGDYDGDGRDDQAIYRNGQWWLNRSNQGAAVFGFGVTTDRAVPRSYVP